MATARLSRTFLVLLALVGSLLAPAQAAMRPQADSTSRIYFGTVDGRVKWIPYSIGALTPTQVIYQQPGSLAGVNGLAIDGNNNYLYWAGQDSTNAGYVRRANLTEGANPTLMWQEARVGLTANYLTGLALDPVDQDLYWSGVVNANAFTYEAVELAAPLVTYSMAEGDHVLTFDNSTTRLLASDNKASSNVKSFNAGISSSTTIASGETKVTSVIRSAFDDTLYWASCLELVSIAAQQDCSGVIRSKLNNAAPTDVKTGITGLSALAMLPNGCLVYGTAKGVIGTVANTQNCQDVVLYDGSEIITSIYIMSSPVASAATTIIGNDTVGSELLCNPNWRPDMAQARLANAATEITYAWNLNGTPITGATSSKFYPQEPGVYTCDSAGFNTAGMTLADRGPGKTIVPGTVVRGKVKNSLGLPIANVTVSVVDSLLAEPGAGIVGSSDSNGDFNVAVPTGGTYYVNFFVNNINRVQKYVNDVTMHPVTVDTGQSSTAQEYTLKAVINYTGTFVEPSGAPKQWVLINAWSSPNANPGPAASDASGNFTLEVEEGTTVRFRFGSAEEFISTWVGGNDYDTATPYPASLSANTNLGTITINRKPIVSGKVVISGTTTVVPGTVTLKATVGLGNLYTAAVAQDGTFSITAPVGTYVACFTATARKYASVCTGNRGTSIDAVYFTLAPNQTKTLNFSVPKTLPIPVPTVTKTSRTSATVRWKSVPSGVKYQVRAKFGPSLAKLSAWTNVYLSTLMVYADNSTAIKKKPAYACYSVRTIGNQSMGVWSAQKCVKLA